jgi:ribosomal protein S3
MFSFGNAMLLTKVIGRLLQTNRRQITVIKFLKKAMAIFFRKLPAKFSSLNGIRITIVGRFNKRPRTKTFVLQQGQLCLQTLSMPIDFHYTQVVTLFGSFGVKVWLSKKIKEKKRVE